MQNLSIPTAKLPLPGNAAASGAPVTGDTPADDTPGAGDFGKVLAQEIAGKTHEHEKSAAGTENPDSATTAPPSAPSDNATLQPPATQDAATAALQALASGAAQTEIIPGYLQQTPSETLPATLSGQAADEALEALSSQTASGLPVSVTPSDQSAAEALSAALAAKVAGEMPAAASSSQAAAALSAALAGKVAGEMPAAAASSQAAAALSAALADKTTGEMPLATSSSQAAGNLALAALQTGTSPQRNLFQGTHSAKSAAELAAADQESGKAANFAAYDKFLPPVATDDKISRAVAQLLTPDSSSATSPLQTGAASAAVLFPGAASIDQNPNLRIEARVGTPAWDGSLAQKVVWMVTQQQQVAQLQLNPPNLGPMEVMLTVGSGPDAQTRIEFTSPHLAVREAIQAALPHLREMMEDNGISLGSATVSADSFQQQAQAGRQDHASPRHAENMSQNASGLVAHSATTRVHTGLVDTFA